MAQKIIQDLLLNIATNTNELRSGLSSAQNQISNFGKNLTKIGAAIGGAFAVKEVAGFAFELSKVAGVSQGVENAFNRLDNSKQILRDLRAATQNTVNDLTLMQTTVKAANFGLDVQQLPQLLGFAAQRARETGESVDHLVESIVVGISRKSTPILDNLGISAVQLKEKLGGVSLEAASIGDVTKAVGEIAADSLSKIGNQALTTADQTAQVSTAWDNMKVAIGKAINSTGLLQKAMEGITKVANEITEIFSGEADFSLLAAGVKNGDSKTLKEVVLQYQKLRNELGKPLDVSNLDELIKKYGLTEEEGKRFIKIVKEINGEIEKKPVEIKPAAEVKPQIVTLESLKATLKDLSDQYEKIDITQTNALRTKALEIIATEEQIKKIQELTKAQKEQEAATHNKSAIPQSFLDFQSNLKNANNGTNKPTFGEGVSAGVAGVDDMAKKQLAIDNVTKQLQIQKAAIDATNQGYTDMGSNMETVFSDIGVTAVGTLSGAFIDMASGAKTTFKDMVGSILASIRNLLIGLFAKALAGIISGAAQSGPPPVALALAAIGVAGITALWSKIPKFEKGGTTSGGWFMAGEKGAELVNVGRNSAAIYNHKDTMSMFNSGGNGDMKLVAVVTGDQLNFVLNESNRRK